MHDDSGWPVPLLHFSIVESIEVLVSSGLHGFPLFVWLNRLDLCASRLNNANFIHGNANTLCMVRASLASSSTFTNCISCFSQLLMLVTPIRHLVCVCVYIYNIFLYGAVFCECVKAHYLRIYTCFKVNSRLITLKDVCS